MTDFATLVRFFFQYKLSYEQVEDVDKEKLFFIFNRHMTRKYPEVAERLNIKSIDKVAALDWWFGKLQAFRFTPDWFYVKAKGKKMKEKEKYPILEKLSEKDSFILEKYFSKELALYKEYVDQNGQENDFQLKKLPKRTKKTR